MMPKVFIFEKLFFLCVFFFFLRVFGWFFFDECTAVARVEGCKDWLQLLALFVGVGAVLVFLIC